MRHKLIFSFFYIIVICSLTACYAPGSKNLKPKIKSPEELLALLNARQLQCIEQVADKDKIVYIELQKDNQFFGAGYIAPDGIYAIIFRLKQEQGCDIEFQRKMSNLQNYFGDKYEPVFKKIQQVELTGQRPPEIYVWLDLYGVEQRNNALHYFFSKQLDGSYKTVLSQHVCRDWNTLEFIDSDYKDRPNIVLTDDLSCSFRGPGQKTRNIWLLNNEGAEFIERNKLLE